ncbi:Na+-transporting methylmalonyl-CoA/oxaloacetate decarboxylase gamma subunit OS=Sphingobium scionense OX=1404341 GN=GGQ90_002895 PE=4 SV=1 [Sphingobium scionense]
MKYCGLGLIGIGFVIAAFALMFMPSTVTTPEMVTMPYSGSLVGSGRSTATYNMPRAQLRELVFHGGGMLFLGGCILLVGGVLDGRLRGNAAARPTVAERDDVAGTLAAPDQRSPVADANGHISPLPDEVERNKRIIGGVIVVGVIVLVVFGITGVTRQTVPDEINIESAAENAARAADEAMNSAIDAADNAARSAGHSELRSSVSLGPTVGADRSNKRDQHIEPKHRASVQQPSIQAKEGSYATTSSPPRDERKKEQLELERSLIAAGIDPEADRPQ